MASPIFTGVGVALVTLFDADGAVDAAATAAHALRLVEEGVSAVVLAGTTGEAAGLDPEERSLLVAETARAIDGRVPLIAGTGAPSARQATALSRRAEADGADALLVLSPPGASDPRPYYEQVAAAVEIPVLAYHFPKVSAPGVPVEALRELPVDGIKDSSGDAERLALEADQLATGIYVGRPSLLLLAGALGCSGAILALANVEVAGCVEALAGDPDAQRRVVAEGAGLPSIAALKRALAERHGTRPDTRLG
ncbi:MAG: dihydrodipicolinate synthase family protein [Solirubrobacterales bacterium]